MSVFRRLFGAYARYRVARGLDGLHVRNLSRVTDAQQSAPVVLAATHVSWWDGMLLFPLDDALGHTTRAWMDAENLARLPFFGSLGALPLDRSSNAGLRRSIREAQRWLDRPGRVLWVFPQGRQRPSHLRPLGLQPGAGLLAHKTGATLLPVAISYGFREAPVPAAVVSVGEPVESDNQELLEQALIRELEHTDRFLLDGDERFAPLVAGRVQATQHSLPARWLSAIGRFQRRAAHE